VDLKFKEIKNILVRSTNWVGDALLTTPALGSLKDNFPQARITVLAAKWVAPVFAEHPAVDEVLVFEREGRHRGLRGLLRLAGELRRRRFDLAVLFQNAIQAALIARLAGIPLRLGYNTDGRGFLLSLPIRLGPEDKKVHETEYYLRILSRAGLKTAKTRPVFHLSPDVQARASERLAAHGLGGTFLLGLAPGAAYGPAKQWPAGRFASAADMILAGKNGTVLLFGSQNEALVTAEVGRNLKTRCLDLAGRTDLAEAAALIKGCGLFLTNDSGLMHVAAAVGAPLVAVFGSTDPKTTAPAAERFRLIRHPAPCAPCLRPTCNQESHLCMESVTAEEVAEAALDLIEEAGHA